MEGPLLLWVTDVSVSPTRRGLKIGHPLSLTSVPFRFPWDWKSFLSLRGLLLSLTTNDSIIQPMVANTLQCALQLSLNELRCVESQGGHPDRGRTSAEKPEWEGAGVRDVAVGQD